MTIMADGRQMIYQHNVTSLDRWGCQQVTLSLDDIKRHYRDADEIKVVSTGYEIYYKGKGVTK